MVQCHEKISEKRKSILISPPRNFHSCHEPAPQVYTFLLGVENFLTWSVASDKETDFSLSKK
jgi:hypothetical protein